MSKYYVREITYDTGEVEYYIAYEGMEDPVISMPLPFEEACWRCDEYNNPEPIVISERRVYP